MGIVSELLIVFVSENTRWKQRNELANTFVMEIKVLKRASFFSIRKNRLVRSEKLVTAWQPVTVLFIRSYKPTALNQKFTTTLNLRCYRLSQMVWEARSYWSQSRT